MTFTDADLKRLKDAVNHQGHVDWNSRAHLFEALIARLEAAEDLIGIPIGSTTWKERYEKWCKAAGK